MLNGKDDSEIKRPVRVVIADNQRATRQGLIALLSLLPQIEIVGEAVDGWETINKVSEHHPDVVVSDVQMPGMSGLEAMRYIKRQWPDVRIVVLTMYAGYRGPALAAGADAFLLKGATAEELANAINPLSHG
ncbi:MAG: response regulator transcription factor [Anaerolineae bacterium]|nr:response regulator transcription factor [Anaerolineae bacterium]